MKNTPVDYQTARKVIEGYGLPDFGKATIREVVAISNQLEQLTKTEFYFYLALCFADWTGLEPATPCVTGMYSNQLNYQSF